MFYGIERMSSYLTNLTVFASAICFTCVATRAQSPVARFFRQPTVVTAVVVYMVFVGIAYNVLLRYLWTPSGYRALVNECLHTFVPVMAALYWVLFVPRFHLEPASLHALARVSARLFERDALARQRVGFLSLSVHRRW